MCDVRKGRGKPGRITGCGAAGDSQQHFPEEAPNAVESWFSQLTQRALQRNSFTGVQALRKEIRRYIQVHNQDLAKPFRWTKNAASILHKVEKVKSVAVIQ